MRHEAKQHPYRSRCGALRNRSRRASLVAALSLFLITSVVSLTARVPARADTDPTINARGWGYNYYGYIGDGSTTDVITPPFPYPGNPGDINTPPTPERYITQISAGPGVLALHADGSVTGWGRNDEGQLGDGGTSYRETSPVHVILPPVVQVSAGQDEFGLGLTSSGHVYSWGNDAYGNLGRASSIGGSYDPTPALVKGLPSSIKSISTGDDHTLALTSGGSVWAWGRNFAGQLGDPNNGASVWQTPFQIPNLSNVVDVSAGGNDSYAVTSNGNVYAWGFDYGGQGHGPSQITGLPAIKRIAAGANHALAIDMNGHVWAWGSNQYGQVGDGGPAGWRSPVELTLSHVVSVSAANADSWAINKNGTVWAWGANTFGELGVGDSNQHATPVQVTGLSNVTGISSNSFASLSWSSLRSTAPPIGDGRMVVLGDSVAAGEGVNYGFYWNGSGWVRSGPASPKWNNTTVALGGNFQACHQSNAAYGLYFHAFKGYTVNNMACTSATVFPEPGLNGSYTAGGVLRYEDFGGGTVVPAQLGGACSGCDVANPLFDNNPDLPSVVLLTVGADDLDFRDWITQCYTFTCGSASDTSLLNSQLFTEAADLRSALTELNRRAGLDNPGQQLRVVVTDYYNPFGNTFNSSCIDTGNGINVPGITSAEQTWIVNGLNSLDQNIYDEIQYVQSNDPNLNISLVDLTGLFQGGQDIMAGHTFCSADPWVYGPSIDYPHWGNPVKPDYPAPMHPTPEGQLAIYKAIVQQAGL
jgi:alpha-tubulin suppressor-like RCC1 family protein